MLNFEVDSSLLESRLPHGTRLDLWEGRALVSLVGFRFLDARVLGVKIPFHGEFEEVNLRFYVQGAQGRGVVFIKEFVPRRAVAIAARLSHRENYVTAPMDHACERQSDRLRVSYGWRCNAGRNFLSVEAAGEPALPLEGSAEAFILEHYWGYTRLREGRSRAYRVDHPPWRAWSAVRGESSVDGDAVYGAGFGEVLRSRPVSAMLSDGSAVSVFRSGD